MSRIRTLSEGLQQLIDGARRALEGNTGALGDLARIESEAKANARRFVLVRQGDAAYQQRIESLLQRQGSGVARFAFDAAGALRAMRPPVRLSQRSPNGFVIDVQESVYTLVVGRGETFGWERRNGALHVTVPAGQYIPRGEHFQLESYDVTRFPGDGRGAFYQLSVRSRNGARVTEPARFGDSPVEVGRIAGTDDGSMVVEAADTTFEIIVRGAYRDPFAGFLDDGATRAFLPTTEGAPARTFTHQERRTPAEASEEAPKVSTDGTVHRSPGESPDVAAIQQYYTKRYRYRAPETMVDGVIRDIEDSLRAGSPPRTRAEYEAAVAAGHAMLWVNVGSSGGVRRRDLLDIETMLRWAEAFADHPNVTAAQREGLRALRKVFDEALSR